jgi:hypothetical protein
MAQSTDAFAVASGGLRLVAASDPSQLNGCCVQEQTVKKITARFPNFMN